MTQRTISAVVNLPREPHAEGFKVAFLHPEAIGGGSDPFLQIDAFALAQPVFKPHPHAGFSAVTYILPESPIGFINRDSLGNRQRIGPGALHWTAAGRGMLHEEVPEQLGVAALGLQMFIDLPLNQKEARPRWFHLEAEEVPEAVVGGATIRAVVGASNGIASPLPSPTPGVRLIDVTLAAGAVFTQALNAGENALVYVLAGTATTVADGRVLQPFDLATTEPAGTALSVIAGADGARLILFGGPPLDQPIVARGPFVLASDVQLKRAMADYSSGRMGSLSANRYDLAGLPVL